MSDTKYSHKKHTKSVFIRMLKIWLIDRDRGIGISVLKLLNQHDRDITYLARRGVTSSRK